MRFASIATSLLLSFGLMGNSMYLAMPDKDITHPLFLLNNKYKISSHYAPPVIRVNVPGKSRYLQKKAALAAEALFAAAKEEGFDLYAISSYRTYGKQHAIYKRKLTKLDGNHTAVQDYIALPGGSEHQLGLAVDVVTSNANLHPNFFQTKEGQWIAENAYHFGFIVRYPIGLEHITGIQYEPWHLRYVGDYASDIHQSGLALESYVSAQRLELYKKLLDNKE